MVNDQEGTGHPIADLIVITGAAGGIGRWISRAVSPLARSTVLVGRDRSSLDNVARGCSGDVRSALADLGTPAALDVMREIVATAGARRIAVVAGAGVVGPISQPGLEDPLEWVSAMETNLLGVFRTVQPYLAIMRESDWGRVVAVSSAQTLHGPDAVMTSYATAKLAVNAFVSCLASSFAGTGVSACAIHPGDVFTGMGEDIARKAEAAGPSAVHLAEWARSMAAGGGDDPREAGRLVAEILTRTASWSNGRFLVVPSSVNRHPASHWSMQVGPCQ